MPIRVTNSTSKLTSADKDGFVGTNSIEELDPWDIADLLICKRGEQLISVEFASDTEFDTWVQSNSVAIKDTGISAWSFDDRCRLVNYVLTQGGMLQFADGSTLPPTNSGNSDDGLSNSENTADSEPSNSVESAPEAG